MKKTYKTKDIKRSGYIWLLVIAFLALLMWIITFKPVAEIVAPMIDMTPEEVQNFAWNIVLIAVGVVLILLALGVMAAIPVLAVVVGLIGAGLIISGAWNIFKNASNGNGTTTG